MWYFTEIGSMMFNESKVRTAEERSRKMLKEEMTVLDLEMAIKKEQYRKSREPESKFHETPTVDKGIHMTSVSAHKTDVQNTNIFNLFLDKIGF